MMMGRLAAIFIAVALLLAGCADNGDPGEQAVILYDVVELARNDDGGSQFLLYHGDGEPVTLTSDRYIGDKTAIGESLVICYTPAGGEAYQSGEIQLRGAYAITNAKMVVEDAVEIAGWDTDPVYLQSLWRAGSKINVRCKLPVSGSARRLALVADATTMNDAVPQLYLAHDLSDDSPTYDRTYYISFDISELWDIGQYAGVDIHVNNSNLPTSLFHIDF